MEYKVTDFEILSSKDPDRIIAEFNKLGFTAPGRDELAPVPFQLPFAWDKDPYKDKNWMFQLHAWRMLDPHFNKLFNGPKEEEIFRFVCETLHDWYVASRGGRLSAYSWFDMSVGLRALKLASLAVLTKCLGYQPTQQAAVEGLVAIHIDNLMDPRTLSTGNHGLFQLNGLMALSYFYPEQPKSEAARNYALQKMVVLIDSQLGSYGVHTEGSPEYHFFAVRKIKRIVKCPWWECIKDLGITEKIEVAEVASNWLVDPLNRCVPVGDSTAKTMTKVGRKIYDWPHCSADKSLGAIVDGYGVVRSDISLDASDSFMLFMTASFYSQTHKHSDCLSFIWQEGGRDILIDSGKYGYQSSKMREYFLSTRAHNTIEINSCSDSRKQADAYGSGIKSVKPYVNSWLIEASSVKAIYSDASKKQSHSVFKHERAVLFRPGRFVCVFDSLSSAKKSLWTFLQGSPLNEVTSWWHLSQEFRLVSDLKAGTLRFRDDENERNIFVTHLSCWGDHIAKTFTGVSKPKTQGWESKEYLKAHPAPALGFISQPAKHYCSVTLIELASSSTPQLNLARGLDRREFILTDLFDPGDLQSMYINAEVPFKLSGSLL